MEHVFRPTAQKSQSAAETTFALSFAWEGGKNGLKDAATRESDSTIDTWPEAPEAVIQSVSQSVPSAQWIHFGSARADGEFCSAPI